MRVLHPVAVHFKGSGFHNTDYGKKKKGGANGGSAVERLGLEALRVEAPATRSRERLEVQGSRLDRAAAGRFDPARLERGCQRVGDGHRAWSAERRARRVRRR